MESLFRNLSENLTILMAKSRLNSTELARLTGVHAATIKRLRNHEHSNPTIMTLLPIAKFFSMTITELLGCEEIDNRTATHGGSFEIPILSWKTCVNFKALDYPKISNKIFTEKKVSEKSFALRVETEDLVFFPKGALLIIDTSLPVQANDYIIVSKNDGVAAIKKYMQETDQIYLKSLIKGLSLIPFNHEYRILGVIVQYKLEFRTTNERDV